MADTRKVIYILAKMGKIVNACAWLTDLANASQQYQIRCASITWLPADANEEITWYKQSNMCLSLVHAYSVLWDMDEFQSLCNLAWAGYFTPFIHFIGAPSIFLASITHLSATMIGMMSLRKVSTCFIQWAAPVSLLHLKLWLTVSGISPIILHISHCVLCDIIVHCVNFVDLLMNCGSKNTHLLFQIFISKFQV